MQPIPTEGPADGEATVTVVADAESPDGPEKLERWTDHEIVWTLVKKNRNQVEKQVQEQVQGEAEARS